MESSAVIKFRLAGKVVFLTWPQNYVVNVVLLDRIVALWGDDVLFAVVATEAHADGEPHLHAIIGFKKRVDLRDANAVLDPLTGKHGNYQTAKSAKKVLRYVCKDGNYVTHGDVPDFVKRDKVKKPGKLDQICVKLKDGADLRSIADEYPGTFLLQKRKIEDVMAWWKRQKVAASLLPWTVPVQDADGRTTALVEWLTANILNVRIPRQSQLWFLDPWNWKEQTSWPAPGAFARI